MDICTFLIPLQQLKPTGLTLSIGANRAKRSFSNFQVPQYPIPQPEMPAPSENYPPNAHNQEGRPPQTTQAANGRILLGLAGAFAFLAAIPAGNLLFPLDSEEAGVTPQKP